MSEDSQHLMKGIRRVTAERLRSGWIEKPQVTLFRTLHLSSSVTGRGFTLRLARAAIHALTNHPHLNALITGNEIVIKGHIDLGIAVAGPRGLVVPVIPSAETLTEVEFEKVWTSLRERATKGRLQPTDVGIASFTITNLGNYGVDWFSPIVNPPAVAILGVGRIQTDFSVVVGLSFDHAAIDGAESGGFLQTFVDSLGMN